MTSKGIRTGAVVLAAGFSSRMGKCKALLDVGGSAALERILSTLRLSGVEDIVVVSGHYREAVEGEAKRGGARAVFNEHYEKGMLSSIKAGVTALSSNLDGFFLLPVDVPLVKPATLQALKQARRSEPNPAVVIPAFLGRRGHPPLVATGLIPGILEWDGPGGLRAFLDRYEEASLVLEMPDQGVVTEMNTPEEYAALRSLASRRGIPTEKECLAFWEILSTPPEVRDHCRVVAEVAVGFARALKGILPVDTENLAAAALLHDMSRAGRDHAEAAAGTLDSWGFAATADLVRYHMDLPEKEPLLSERSLLYLADKVVSGNRIVGLERKAKEMEKRFETDPEALTGARFRLQRAERISKALERLSEKDHP
mgnify:CR=1 FL=1